jgi:hypothetical protein
MYFIVTRVVVFPKRFLECMMKAVLDVYDGREEMILAGQTLFNTGIIFSV